MSSLRPAFSRFASTALDAAGARLTETMSRIGRHNGDMVLTRSYFVSKAIAKDPNILDAIAEKVRKHRSHNIQCNLKETAARHAENEWKSFEKLALTGTISIYDMDFFSAASPDQKRQLREQSGGNETPDAFYVKGGKVYPIDFKSFSVSPDKITSGLEKSPEPEGQADTSKEIARRLERQSDGKINSVHTDFLKIIRKYGDKVSVVYNFDALPPSKSTPDVARRIENNIAMMSEQMKSEIGDESRLMLTRQDEVITIDLPENQK